VPQLQRTGRPKIVTYPKHAGCADACQSACFLNARACFKHGFHSRDFLRRDRRTPEFDTCFASALLPGEDAFALGESKMVSKPFGSIE
jgi:hypothetical protein